MDPEMGWGSCPLLTAKLGSNMSVTEADLIVYRLKNPRLINNVDRSSIYAANVRREDHPDYCDAYIDEAYWKNGDMLINEDLDWIMDEYHELLHEAIFQQNF